MCNAVLVTRAVSRRSNMQRTCAASCPTCTAPVCVEDRDLSFVAEEWEQRRRRLRDAERCMVVGWQMTWVAQPPITTAQSFQNPAKLLVNGPPGRPCQLRKGRHAARVESRARQCVLDINSRDAPSLPAPCSLQPSVVDAERTTPLPSTEQRPRT